jgi:sirohydrochlorin ferrochelatase
MTPGEIVLTRIGVGDCHPEVADVDFERVDAGEQNEGATRVHLGCKVFRQHGGADDFGVERQPEVFAFEIGELSTRPGGGR